MLWKQSDNRLKILLDLALADTPDTFHALTAEGHGRAGRGGHGRGSAGNW